MYTFVENHHGVMNYTCAIRGDDLEKVFDDFYDALEDFPDPLYKWLDERLPFEQHGPNTWSLEISNDQETAFTFYVNHLSPEVIQKLRKGLENVILQDSQNVSFGDAFMDMTYYVVIRYAERSETSIVNLTYHVYWRESARDNMKTTEF